MRLVLSVFTIAAATMAAPGRVWAGPEENKAVVLGYEDMIFHQHKVAEGIEKYVAPNYVQHSPEVPPGKQGLSDRMSGPNSVIMQPGRHHDVIKVIAAGDEHVYQVGKRRFARVLVKK